MFSQEVAEIYGLHCPKTGDLRYIGKAVNSRKRLASHLRDARRRHTPLYEWINALSRDGLAPVMKVLCQTWDWPATERAIIAQERESGIRLLNVAAGGNEPHCSTAVRAENGRNNARAVHSDPLRRRVWQLRQQLGVALKKGHLNEQTKEKMRIAARKRPDLFGAWASI
jgi:hypothetical protein